MERSFGRKYFIVFDVLGFEIVILFIFCFKVWKVLVGTRMVFGKGNGI